MGKIVLLDDLTINKIAAGEVIERPASVVKEMVENSIDAGANKITVEIRNGGISYIRISDNGKGISEDDLEIAFERHATSKIRSASDLDTVTSMGFRGEALASIAAIANVEMISKTAEQDSGYKVVVEGGDVLEKEVSACSTGTTITVKNLFFNTPVRYKFLKKDFTESGYIEDAVTRIALVHPEIAIKLINTGKTVIQTTGNGDLKSVIYSIYGKDVAEGILNVDYTYEDIEVKGVVGKPEIARSNRSNQLFFVNKRFVKDKTLSSAAEQSFKGMLPIGKFGFIVLDLEINPAKVDVNVHPAKLEVRFEEEGKVFKAVYHALKETLLRGDLVADTEKEKFEKDNIIIQEPEKKVNAETIDQEPEKVNNFGGLFRFKKPEKEEIKENEKTENNILEQVYNKNTVEENKEEYNRNATADAENIFARLEELKSTLQNEIKEKAPEVAQKVEETVENVPSTIETILNNFKNAAVDIEKDYGLNRNIQTQENLTQDEEKSSESSNGIMAENSEEKTEINAVAPIKTEDAVKAEAEIEALKGQLQKLEANTSVVSNNFEEMYMKTFGKTIDEDKKEEKNEDLDDAIDIVKENVNMFENIPEYKKPVYKFIGIVFNTYIIIEMDSEMYIIDQHAAHERIMYEKVKKNYYSDDVKDSQMLLLPDVITLTHKEMDVANENLKMFEKAGFTLEEFGENTIKLTGVPEICVDLDTKELFLETLDEINTVARTAKQEIEEKFIATVACKAAVKAHMVLAKEEVESLMDSLLQLPNPFTCPHGRPTAIKMTKYDIEKKFARRK